MSYANRKILLEKRPQGAPDPSCWRLVDEEIDGPAEGQALVEVTHISIDPAMRAWLDESSYFPPVPIGDTMRGLGVGTVVESRDERLVPGDHVHGPLGVQKYACLPSFMLRKITETRVAPSAFAGALGLTGGLTAYFGMLRCGRLQQGDTVLMSTAAGAVGSMAGQIAKINGAGKVIGIAGGPEKVRYVIDELGMDDCIDYKNDDVYAAIGEKAPDGIDIYFDNVGVPILDYALDHLRQRARVVLCGAITQYNRRDNVEGPKNYIRLAERNAILEGFTVDRWAKEFPEAEAHLTDWLVSGQLKVREHVEKGIENYHATLMMLFEGSHYGKLLLQP